MINVLIIEDEHAIRRFLRTALEADGLRVYEAETLQRGLLEAATRKPDLIILDLGLPDGDGIDFIRDLRQWSAIPVIVLSARSEESDKIAALDAGADDYLIKPYEFDELIARIHALLRRCGRDPLQQPTESKMQSGDVILDVEQHVATLNGVEVELSNREWAILMPLMLHPNKIFSKANLEDKLYAFDSEISSNTIEVYVHHLRAKLGKDFIRTIRGLGYRLGQPQKL